MKKHYQVKEICHLYHIGPDSLRYYEKIGLITPRRSRSNYRIYSLSDIWRLNVIRDLLELGFDTKKIKSYLDNRTVEETQSLLDEKEDILTARLKEIQNDLADVRLRRKSLQEALDEPLEQIRMQSFNQRPCLILKDSIQHEEDIDYLLTKLSGRADEPLAILGNSNTGSIIKLNEDGTVQCHSVFICTEGQAFDFILEKGRYLTLTFCGRSSSSPDHIHRLRDYMQQNDLTPIGDYLEFLLIDIHETQREQEYVTQLQIRIRD